MNNEILKKKALDEYQQAEKQIQKICCSTPNYDMALVSYNKAFTYYIGLKDNPKIIEISDKIVHCNRKINNYLGIALQYEKILNYLSKDTSPIYFIKICNYFELSYKARLEINDIYKSACILITFIKYLDKINCSDDSKYLYLIKKTT